MRSLIQRELDTAEEYVLAKLFGNSSVITLKGNIKLIASMAGINIEDTINKWIQVFESFSKAYMNEDGYYVGEQVTELLEKITGISGFVVPDFKPIDLAIALDKIVNLERFGHFIHN